MSKACPLCGRSLETEEGLCARCDGAVDIDKVLGFLEHSPPPAKLPPRQIGRYRVVKPIGEGGSGVVYEAIDSALGRTVALKVLKTSGLGREYLERFLREARLLARLEHPNIVRIFELGREEGRDFLVMELVEGRPFPATAELREAVRRLALVARALHHAHGRGVIHRDLKPSNVLVDPAGRPVLMDFGIARAADGASSLTGTGALIGTPGYMSPEQLEADATAVDPRSDIWALGALLYEVLTGRRAYSGNGVLQIAAAVRRGPPPSPRSVRPDVPPALEEICLRAMARRPEDRPSRAKDFAGELETWLRGPSRAPFPSRPRPWIAALGAAALLVLLGLGIRVLRGGPAALPEPPAAEGGHLERAGTLLAGGLPADFDGAWKLQSRAEVEYREAPRSVTSHRELGRLLAARFHVDAAHEEYDRALDLAPEPETLTAKADLLLTSLLVYRIDRLRFPELVQSLLQRLATTQGPAFDRLASRFPPESPPTVLARACALAARGRYDEARRLVDVGPTRIVLDYLDDALRAGALLSLASGGADPPLSFTLILGQERKSLIPRTGIPALARHPLHAGLIRLDAWALDARGEDAPAAARLGDALLSAPDYLPARLARAKLLESLGDAVQAAAELGIARKQARAAGLGELR